MTLIYSFPLPILFLLILMPCLVVGLAGTWLIRRRGWMVDGEDNDAVTLTHAFAGVLYAVALGLMVVNVQSGYTEVKMVVMHEANLVANLFVDASGLPDPARQDIQRLTLEYIDSIIDEWEEIGDEDESDLQSHEDIVEISHHLLEFQPQSDKSSVVYGELLDDLNEILELRRERLHLGRDGVGPITWVVVAIGALITIGMTWFYKTNSPRTHYLLVGVMGTMFGLMIFLIVAMDHPLLGRFSVDKTPFLEAKEDMQVWENHSTEI